MRCLSALAPKRFIRIQLTVEPGSAFHRNPAKPGVLSDSCAEPHNETMKLKTCDEDPTALRNFTRAMQALFRVSKADVVELKHKPARKKSTKSH